MATVSVRYIVDDVAAAIAFYCQQLGFREEMHPAPAFAMLSRGDLRLVLSAPGGGPGGGQAMPDGRLHELGTDIWIALAWCAGILIVAYALAMATYHRKTA
jgi:catechol 2,3-dioxygenase-like lactoylglutathione lyase family enzyme